MNKTAIFGIALFATLHKSKRDAAPRKPLQIASHLLFPNPPKTLHYRLFFSLTKSNCIHLQINSDINEIYNPY
jgi:hypothetical protein